MDSSYSRRERVSAFDEADDASEDGRAVRDDEFAVFDAIAADIASEVDLVDELERILRGEAEYDQPSEPEEMPALGYARPATAEDEVADEEEERPYQAAIPPAVDLDAVDEEEFSPEAAGFWRPQGAPRSEMPLRQRRAPRTDLIVVASLAIVVLGLGAFAAFGGWGGAQPIAGVEAAAEPVADVEAPALADVAAAEPLVDTAPVVPEPTVEEEPVVAPDPALDPDYAAPALDPRDLLGMVSGQPRNGVSASPDSLALVEPKEEIRVPEGEPVTPPAAAQQPVRDAGLGGPLELMPETLPAEPAVEAQVANVSQPPVETAAAEPVAAAAVVPSPEAGAWSSSATVTSSVNMRGGPDNGAPVVTVVPAGSTVGVIACAYWCEVSFDGQSGWIYRDFLRMQ